MVTKLDRLARSFLQGSKIVSDLIDKGVRVHILNIGIMDNTPSSKLIKNVFTLFTSYLLSFRVSSKLFKAYSQACITNLEKVTS